MNERGVRPCNFGMDESIITARGYWLTRNDGRRPQVRHVIIIQPTLMIHDPSQYPEQVSNWQAATAEDKYLDLNAKDRFH